MADGNDLAGERAGQQSMPPLGRRRVTEIARLHAAMKDHPTTANRCRALLSKMFNLAELWGIRPDGSNPCRHIQRYAEVQRERFLSDQELTYLGEALTEAEETAGKLPGVIAAIRLLALTGCRLGEILGLRWADVDLGAGALSIRDAKTGDRVHSIGAPACALLDSLPRKSGWVVFSVSPKRPIPVSTIENAWSRLRERATVRIWARPEDSAAGILVAELTREHCREPTYRECIVAAESREIDLPPGIADARLHDLRHTVGTYAAQAGANAFLVRDKLGHKTLTMTGRYVGRDADPLRALSDAVEGRIAGAMGGNSGDVVALAGRRK